MTTLFSPALIFSSHALIYISLFSRLPEITKALDVTKGTIGAVMLCSAVGVLLMTPFAGRLVARLSPPIATVTALCSMATIMPLITLSSIWILPVLFFVYGGMSCMLGVASNLIALRIEKDTDTKILARAHGFWSVGMILGTLCASGLQANAVSPFIHTILTLAVVLCTSYGVLRKSPRDWPAAPAEKGAKVRFTPAILLICFTVWGLALLEGANYDWALFYLQEVNAYPAATASLVYTFMSIGMLMVRMVGDMLRTRFNDALILRGSAVCGVVAIGLFLSVDHIVLTALAMLLMGCAVALIFPTGVSLASSRSGMDPSSAIAAFSATLTLGQLAIPPAMGVIADVWGLGYIFGVLLVPIAFTFLLANKAANLRA